MQLIFATHNKHKSKEVKSVIPNSITVSDLSEIGYHKDIAETADTIEGNALLKAQTIFNETGMNCFSDDSGLLVDALNGAPGVYSARYAGEQKNDEDNLQKLLKELSGKENRKAYFKTVIALLIDGKEQLFEGIINGAISHEKKGTDGFGYDPIFIPDGYQRSFAEMSLEEKSTISHRAIALKKMIEFLKTI
jgi:XTP/dITP diphosphohydrolase